MSETKKGAVGYTVAGLIFIAIGLAVFVVRIGHPGPYAMPQGAGFYGALLALILGGFLMWPGKPRFTGWIAIVLALLASLPAIYSIVGESEEVISLYATDSEGNIADLRLWIVDREDGAWVGMGRGKATTFALDGARMEMLRKGNRVCVIPALYEDLDTSRTIHAMKVEKYVAAQVAAAVGLYPREATPTTVVLRLDPCDP